jgi:hypothetical protein
MHLDRRTLQELLGDKKGVVRGAPDGGALDQVLGTHPLAAVADVVPVHAAGGGGLLLLAEQALHFFRLGQVFDGGPADGAAGCGGHVVGVL